MAEAFCKLTFRSSSCSGARLSTTSRVACGWNAGKGITGPKLQRHSLSHSTAVTSQVTDHTLRNALS